MLLLRRSLSRQAFDHAFVRGVVLVSEETGWEPNDVLRQSELENYVREEERIEFLTAFIKRATLSARTTRRIRLLRAHGLIHKIPTSHRHRLTERGQLLTAAVSAARSATLKDLFAKAA